MIIDIIKELSESSPCKFKGITRDSDEIYFFKAASDEHQRFLIVMRVEELFSPEIINQLVLERTPDEIISSPYFSKNTDVIIIFKVKNLSDIMSYEHDIFSIEEDYYSFKKHVLYISHKELELLKNTTAQNIHLVIKNQTGFNEYKESPLNESLYGISSRIYIKLPFICVPIDESQLDSPESFIEGKLQESGLLDISNKLDESLLKLKEPNKVIEDYINEQMADS